MNILESILLEFGFAGSVSVQEITNSVTNMLPAKIIYDDGKDGQGKGERIICPVAYGISTAGNPVIRAFQLQGSTKSEIPHWKLFKVPNIKLWDTISTKYDPSKLVGFNKDGDKQIEIIYSIAPIGNAKDIEISKSQNMPANLTTGPVKKIDLIIKNNDIETKDVDQQHYTADNAIDDVLKSANLSNVTRKVDNEEEKQYTTNELPAQETKPVTAKEIPGGDKKVDDEEFDKKDEPKTPVNNEPIKKDDLTQDNELTNKFNDLMNRWEENNDSNELDKNGN